MVNQLMKYVSVGTGGFLGALCRYALSMVIKAEDIQFPLETLVVNLVGSFALGFFITLTIHRWNINPNLRLAIATGFWGSFTTYSTFAVGTISLLSDGRYSAAVTYILASFLGCFFLTFAGIYCAERLAGKDERTGDAQ